MVATSDEKPSSPPAVRRQRTHRGPDRENEQATVEAHVRQAQRLESIGQLTSGIAHDFNNLLAGIMSYAGLVASGLEHEMDRRGLTDDEAFVTLAQDVDQITKVAKRAATLTHKLLMFSRREVVEPEALDLNAVVMDMEDLLRRTIGENVDHIRTVLAAELPLITADRGQIDQVVMNLAVNARDAMPGSGELEIETSVIEVDVDGAESATLDAGTYVRLTVTDTGTGMSAAVAAHAFEPYFTTKPDDEGTGLGLATVYGIVTEAGGTVAIHSEPGLGTTIRVDLPATPGTTLPPPELPQEAPPRGNGETVLLVEDEDIVRDPARRVLARAGYTVLAAQDVTEALALAGRHDGDIDLVITDIVMPGRSGKDLSTDLAVLRPDTRVLFMSGYSHGVAVHHGVLDRGCHLIEKPFSTNDLLRRIRDVLDGGS